MSHWREKPRNPRGQLQRRKKPGPLNGLGTVMVVMGALSILAVVALAWVVAHH